MLLDDFESAIGDDARAVRGSDGLQFGSRLRQLKVDAVRMQRARDMLYAAGHTTDVHRFDDDEVLEQVERRFVLKREAPAQLLRLVVTRAEEAAPPSAAVRPSQLVPRRQEIHWVQFSVVDKLGKPIGGLPYKLIQPGGSLEKDTLPMSGRVRKDDVKIGTFTLELGELRSADWAVSGRGTKGPLPANTALTLLAQSRHIPPGTVAKFKVFRLFDEEPGRAIGTADGQVGGDGSISASFTYTVADDDHGREVALIHACSIGKLWVKSPPITLRLPRLAGPRWSTDELTVGNVATLAVDCPGIADGETVRFTIRRADTGAAVAEMDATVRGEAALATWESVDPDPETPETELHFDAVCKGLTTRSRALRLLDDVELVFQDEQGAALSNARVTLEFGDGTRRVFQTDGGGSLKLTDPRARTARVIVAGAHEDDITEEA